MSGDHIVLIEYGKYPVLVLRVNIAVREFHALHEEILARHYRAGAWNARIGGISRIFSVSAVDIIIGYSCYNVNLFLLQKFVFFRYNLFT